MQARRTMSMGAALAAGLLLVSMSPTATAAPPPPTPGSRPQNVQSRPLAEVRGAPVDTSPHVLTQPDGATFSARAVGDAVSHAIETLDGYTVVQVSSGRWEYADGRAANGKLKTSGRSVGQDRPAPGTAKHQRDVAPTPTTTLVPEAFNTGTQPTLVILVQFTNQASIGSTPAQWSGKYFGSGSSVRSYYRQASGNQLDFAPAAESNGQANDGVVGWLTLPYAHPNFGSDYTAVVNGVIAEKQLTKDAIVAADPYVDYSAYDTNGDGNIQPSELHVTVIVAGYESAPVGACGPGVWGHKSNLYGTYTPLVDNVWTGNWGYTQFGEWHRTCTAGSTWNNMATIGIMVHEIGHDIGWPDLYDTIPGGQNPDSSGIGKWSVMAGGTWGTLSGQNLGDSPVLPDAWSRSFQGWVTPTPVGASSSVTLRSAATSLDAVRLRDNPNGVDWRYGASGTGEYFLVENRQRSGFDAALPGCGLLVWHIDETRPGDNTANSNELRRLVDLEEADGLNELDAPFQEGDTGDPFPGSTANLAFTSTTNPDSNLYSGAASGVSVSLTNQVCAPSMSATVSAGGSTGLGNDAFATAQVLSGASGSVTGTSVGATKESGEPNHASNPGGASVWYSWTAPASGKLTVSSAGSSFDTLLGIYQGTNVSALTVRGSNDDENNAGGVITSRVADLAVTGGQVYRVAVDGFKDGAAAAESGTVKIAWSLAATPPANDGFAAAQLLSGASGSVTGTSLGATKEAGEPNHASNLGGASVWYSWTAPASGKLTVSSAGSSFDTLLGIYQGTSVSTLTVRASNDDENNAGGIYTSKVTDLAVTGGQVYRVAVDGFKDGAAAAAAGSVKLAWSFAVAPPANDGFAAAQVLSGPSGLVTGTSLGATKESGEPNHASNPGGASVWYSWTAPASGKLSVSSAGSSFDTLLGIYQGTSVGALTVRASNDDENNAGGVYTSKVTDLAVTGGQVYRVALDGFKDGAAAAESGTAKVAWSFAATPPAPSHFTPLTPVRLLDTRSGVGAPKAAVGAGGTVSLKVAGVGGVPATGVGAVVLNVTATQPSSAGHVTVWPAGEARPATSNLNFVRAQTVPNLVVVKVGAGGNVSLYNSSGSTQLIADVMGWFPQGSDFTGVSPTRLLDTRSGNGAPQGPVPGGQAVSLDVTGRGGVPATGVSAVVLNVTVTGPTTSGYVTVWPHVLSKPATSNLNFSPGQTVPNLVIVKVGPDGLVDLFNSAGQTHVLADVMGWFPDGSEFTGLTPVRLLDTRSGVGAPKAAVGAGGTVSLKVAGVGGVPATGVGAVVLNVTATQPSSAGHVTVWPAGEARPATSNLNFVRAQTVPNLVVVKVGAGGNVSLYNSSGSTQLIGDVMGWFPIP